MKFLVALALFALIAAAAAVVAPVLPAAFPAGVAAIGYAGRPAAVVAPGVLREYHGSPLIHGYYAGLVA